MKVKEESKKAGLKSNIQKTKIMASGPITSWQIDEETMETVTDFIFLVSKITADGDCSHEIKRCLLLRRKAMANLDSIFKSRDITLPTKVCLSSGFFSSHIWMWELDHKGWAPKNDDFDLWCWRRLLRVPWTARRSKLVHPKGNQSWIFIGKDLYWRWSSSTLAIWYEELTHWKRPWCWERLKAGGEGDNRGQDGWMASLTQWTWVWASSGRWWRTGKTGILLSMG